MGMTRRKLSSSWIVSLVAAMAVLRPPEARAQGQTGALYCTVKDESGGALVGAVVKLSSPALIGGEDTRPTNPKGLARFPVLPPGRYALDVELKGFRTSHEADILIASGATLERTVVLKVGVEQTMVVEASGSRIEARDAGLRTTFNADHLGTIPVRRFSTMDHLKTAPGVSATSPTGTTAFVSVLGSGVDQNLFLMDGTNMTATSNGVARVDPGIDFVQEMEIQAIGASAEYGNAQGGVVNIITRSGGNYPSFDAAYYGQPASLTSQPVRTTDSTGKLESGYERATYRDFTTSLGGPVVRDRVWFFAGYQYLRDADSQPGTDPNHPRRYDQDKVFGKVTWRFSPAWQLDQSFHDEYWTTGERPTVVRPFEATQRLDAHTPVINFGHLTHTLSGNTIWDVRFSRFHFSQETSPSTGDRTIPNRVDQPGDVWSQAPQQIGGAEQIRNTGKATATHYRAGATGVDQEWKFGGQFDKGQHRGLIVLPTGERVVYTNGVLSQRVQQKPSNSGGQFVTAGAFVSDAMTIHDRATITAGLRYDYSRAMSPDIAILDGNGDDTGATAPGAGHLYTWNVWSPRVGATIKLDHWPLDAARDLREIQSGHAHWRDELHPLRRDAHHDDRGVEGHTVHG